MRETNNGSGKSVEVDPNSEEHYVIFDVDTNEYLVHWDEVTETTTCPSLDLWGDDAYDEFYTVAAEAVAVWDTPVGAMDVLVKVASELCERFPEELVNLIVKRVRTSVIRSVEVEDVGGVQTFGEDPEEWAVRALDTGDALGGIPEEDEPPPAPKPKKAKKKAKKSLR